jgi:hypothetical protein
MVKNQYSERLAMDDAKGILENVMHQTSYTNQTREELAAVLRQIVAREQKK